MTDKIIELFGSFGFFILLTPERFLKWFRVMLTWFSLSFKGDDQANSKQGFLYL